MKNLYIDSLFCSDSCYMLITTEWLLIYRLKCFYIVFNHATKLFYNNNNNNYNNNNNTEQEFCELKLSRNAANS